MTSRDVWQALAVWRVALRDIVFMIVIVLGVAVAVLFNVYRSVTAHAAGRRCSRGCHGARWSQPCMTSQHSPPAVTLAR